MNVKVWLQAFRLRTLPLSLACIGMGGFLAAAQGAFDLSIFLLCCLTTVFLQILSNLANDYGDSVHGADHAGRLGPARAVQQGAISAAQMKRAIILFIELCLASGITLLWRAFGANWQSILSFLALGLISILAAIGYTMGKKPYGYLGLGDFSVFIFFGLVGVMGSLYLFTHAWRWVDVLPAMSCGLFSIGVLNINNTRDIESDRTAGKYSIPVRIGKRNAALYQCFLLAGATLAAVLFVALDYQSPFQFLFLITVPLQIHIAKGVLALPSPQLDPYLKKMALTTLVFVLFFGAGLLLSV
jgi:1,4-dihydroxy-2-naphthoate octaprenyltransferase